MQSLDIASPIFRCLKDQNRHTISRAVRAAMDQGWIPVGQLAQSGREWVQTMVREGGTVIHPEAPHFTMAEISHLKAAGPGNVQLMPADTTANDVPEGLHDGVPNHKPKRAKREWQE